MTIETQDLPAPSPAEAQVKPKGKILEKAALIAVAMFAAGIMIAWISFLVWCAVWLLAGLA